MSATSAEAIRAAAGLLAKARGDEAGEAPGSTAVLPTAALQQALADLTDARNSEELLSRRPDMKGLMRGALDWDKPASTRATKPVVKAVSAGLIGKRADGASTYCQSVEMVSYLSLWASLLEPDRLARVAEALVDVETAYAPIKYSLGPSGQLRVLMRGVNDERREKLAISLWHQAHDGRWWEHTVGDPHVGQDGRLRTGRRRRNGISTEQAEVIAKQVKKMLDAHGRPSASLLTRAINAGQISYSNDSAAAVRKAREPKIEERRALLKAIAETRDADHLSLAASLPWLAPGERPESPIPGIIALLLTSLGGPSQFRPELLPEKPEEFSDLFPMASRELFNLNKAVLSLNGTRMPGLAGCDVVLMQHADDLVRNKNYMGNCTTSYLNDCIAGRMVILRFSHDGKDYNVSYVPGRAGDWVMREVNTRFNAGGVAKAANEACQRLAGIIGKAMATPDD